MISLFERVRLVLDTNVLIAALRSDRGASRKLLFSALDGRIRIASSVLLFLEYEAILTRQDQLDACGLSRQEAIAVLDALAAVVDPVRLRFLWRPQLKDPADEMVLETAVNGGADRLVTFNLRHLKQAAERFGIRAVSPPEAWTEVEHGNETK